MADKDTNAPKGADWEVVSLTASAYAFAPGGKIPDTKHEEKSEVVEKEKVETSNPLFMSGHFSFPPKQNTEIHDHHTDSESLKEKENYDLKKLTDLDNYHNIPFPNEKEFTESTLNLASKEQSIYSSSTIHSLHNEATMGALNLDDEIKDLNESINSNEEPYKEENYEESGVTYAIWLKKRAVSLYANTKETRAFWSIFAAATVVGIVIIGQRWQHERWQVLRHEWKFRIHDEKMRMMAGPMSRFRDVIAGGNRRDFSVSGNAPRESFGSNIV